MASASVGDCLSGAWGTFKKNVLTHVVCTLLVTVVAGISAGLLAGPMMVGYMRMIERETRGEAVQIGDVFRGGGRDGLGRPIGGLEGGGGGRMPLYDDRRVGDGRSGAIGECAGA